MKRRSIIWAFFVFLFLGKVDAQEKIYLEGIVVDSLTEEILEAVNIFDQQSNTGVFSNFDGRFKIKVDRLPTTLIFSFIGYENKFLTLDSIPDEEVKIVLKPSAFRLPDIEVLAQPKIEKLTEPIFTIKDFVIENDKILLVKYGGITVGNVLELRDLDGEVLQSIPVKVKGIVESMHQGCLGNIHLVGGREVIEVDFSSGKINLISKYPRIKFEELMRPCVESSDDYIYKKTEKLRGQFVKFDFISKTERKIKNTITVADEESIMRMPEELGGLGFAENKYNATHSHTGPDSKRPEHFYAWIGVFYKPLYSPLYNTGEEICLFNHTLGFLRFYTFDGELKRQIPISYHLEKKWDSKILKDKETGKFYTVYKDGKEKKFYEINLKDGTINPASKIECNFVEKMVMHDGNLYYQDSGVLSGQGNRILHKVKIR